MKKPKRGKVPAKKKTEKRSLKATGKRHSKARTNGSGKHATGERSQVLPGMKRFRDEVLDNYCESIGDSRGTMASARADEQASLQGALKRMATKKVDTYRHGRVELLRSPGEEKIRARVLKSTMQMAEEGGPIESADENTDTAEDEPMFGEDETREAD